MTNHILAFTAYRQKGHSSVRFTFHWLECDVWPRLHSRGWGRVFYQVPERKTRKSQRRVLTTHLFKASSATKFLLKLLNSGQVLSIHSITWTSRLIKETSQVPQALPSTIAPATLQRCALCFSVSHIARSVPRHSNHFSFTPCSAPKHSAC